MPLISRLYNRLYDRLMYGMAWLAGALMALMMISICIDVLLRNLGFQSSAHLFTFTEYALLIVPCLGAPWLVRERGHVYVEIVLMHLSAANQRRMSTAVGLFCVAVCLAIAWYGFDVTWTNYTRRDVDVRSMDMPRWMVVIFIPLAFAMMALEFARHMLRGESVLGNMASAVNMKDAAPVPGAAVAAAAGSAAAANNATAATVATAANPRAGEKS